MGVNGRFDNPTRDDLRVVADRFGITRANEILREIDAALERWPQYAAEAGLG